MRKHLRKCRMLCIYSTCPENENGILIDDYERYFKDHSSSSLSNRLQVISHSVHIVRWNANFAIRSFPSVWFPLIRKTNVRKNGRKLHKAAETWRRRIHALEPKVGSDLATLTNELVYHLQMQLNEAEERYTREIQQAKYDNESLRSVNENLKREIEFKDSQSNFT